MISAGASTSNGENNVDTSEKDIIIYENDNNITEINDDRKLKQKKDFPSLPLSHLDATHSTTDFGKPIEDIELSVFAKTSRSTFNPIPFF